MIDLKQKMMCDIGNGPNALEEGGVALFEAGMFNFSDLGVMSLCGCYPREKNQRVFCSRRGGF